MRNSHRWETSREICLLSHTDQLFNQPTPQKTHKHLSCITLSTSTPTSSAQTVVSPEHRSKPTFRKRKSRHIYPLNYIMDEKYLPEMQFWEMGVHILNTLASIINPARSCLTISSWTSHKSLFQLITRATFCRNCFVLPWSHSTRLAHDWSHNMNQHILR